MSRVDEAFIYVPLQPGQIRLLLPHIQADGRVHWSLANEQFLDPSGNRTSLEYDALSYTWGDSTPNATKFPVVCNDQQILVHHNLNTALPFLARRNSPVPIWIDAVCINQPDEEEKYHQIQMMFQIYQCAAQVWVWLGPGNDRSGTVVARLNELPVETKDDIKNQTTFFKNKQNVPWLDSSETWSSFYDLVDNAWYTRLWVFQEVAFAKKVRVLLGAHEVDWLTLKSVVKGSNSGLFVGHDGTKIGRVNRYAYKIFTTRLLGQRALEAGGPMEPHAVARVVSAAMRAHCYDRRDRVFALLGFVPLQVSQNMSWQELYSELAQWILSSVDTTLHYFWDFLHSAESTHKLPGLPSWCPDFHDVEGRRVDYGRQTSFCASPSRGKTDKGPELRPGELVLRGQLFDQVERVFNWYSGSSDVLEDMELLLRWIEDTEVQVCSNLLTKGNETRVYHDNDSIKAAYWDTLNTSLTNVDVPPVMFQTLNDLKNSWEQNAHQLETLALLDEIPFAADPYPEGMPDFMKFMTGAVRVSALMDDQRLFTTTSGRIGHAFPNVSLGDQICVFSDARVVHIVRQKPSEHTYEFVGPAYVHGMMHGEIAKLDIVEQDVILV